VILKDIGFLCVANNRSRYYIRGLIEKQLIPSVVIYLKNPDESLTPGQKQGDLGNEFIDLLKAFESKLEVVNSVDVNSSVVIETLQNRNEKYFIYSGPGGAILRDEILSIGKEFLHVHPGSLPNFRGSTTIYYQYLTENCCGSSAIFFTKGIDEGPILGMKTFEVPKGVDLDYDFDPDIRARVLVDVLEEYNRSGNFKTTNQNQDEGETYFIMHPVLRHIAKLKAAP